MPKKLPVPSYRLHKPSGQAVVTVRHPGGARRDVYLGVYNTQESRREYARIIAELSVGPLPSPAPVGGEPHADLTVNEVLDRFLTWAETHYRDQDGNETTEVGELKWSIKLVRELYSHTPAASFGPLALKAVRQRMIDRDWCRSLVNRRVDRIRRKFKWAASEELVPVTVYQSLRTVAGLRRGRSEARESEPVKPVDPATVATTVPFLNRHLRAMVELQRLTGMRPGEVCALKLSEVDRAADPWAYRPARHKTAHHGKERVVMIGPRGRAVIESFVAGGCVVDPTHPLFSPFRARQERFADMRANRKSKVPPSQADRRKAKPVLLPAAEYTPHTYANAIRKAAEKAGAAHWHPNQLRHLYASEVRKAHGLEAAQVLLGHSRANITEVYAERDLTLAASVAARIW